ncbi:unnamed protein product [Adineta ricciae]|uniref:Apple domain-containing protein n=1 Tax=Adineta ricciae TaxID=249248 RepID=A0A815Y4Q0_ADIRI|nr:unnamed protein product [Adineta ricciae]CAF1566700.1 unnamed protein product [Adineta ricciae]
MQDIKSFTMTAMNGLEFQCANSTCLPFVTTTTLNILECQIHCLQQLQCKAITFQEKTGKCQSFINIVDQNNNFQEVLRQQPRHQQVQPQLQRAQHQLVRPQHQQVPHQLQQAQHRQHQARHQLVRPQYPRYQQMYQFVVRNKRNNYHFLCAEQ